MHNDQPLLQARPRAAWSPFPHDALAPLGPPIPNITSEPLRHPLRAAVVVAVVCAIVVPNAPLRSLGFAIALGLILGAAIFVAGRDRRSIPLALAAASLLPWLAIRHSPWLHGVNLIVALLLFLTAAAQQPGEPLAAPMHRYLRSWWAAAAATIFGPGMIVGLASEQLQHVAVPAAELRRLGRGLLIAVGASLTVAALLASGDALFASYIDVNWAWSWGAWPFGSAMVGVWLLVLALGAARSRRQKITELRALDTSSIVLTLTALSLTILSYGIVQLTAALSGPEYVQRRTGLTYAEYARSGFFQLVAVVAIAVAALAAARSTAARLDRQDRYITWWAAVLTCGVISLVVSSVLKLAIYAERLGLTMLRVYTITFAVWLGVVALLTFVALMRPSGKWLTPALLVSVVVGAFAMNVANPERIVAEHNVERARGGADLDLDYLSTLSLDARPAVLEALTEFRIQQRDIDRSPFGAPDFCAPLDSDRSWFGFNLAVNAARRAQQTQCVD